MEKVVGVTFSLASECMTGASRRSAAGVIPERIGKWLTGVARRDTETGTGSCSVPHPVSLYVGFCTRPMHSTRLRRRPEPGWRCGGSSLRLAR